jgi:hypothetical protein
MFYVIYALICFLCALIFCKKKEFWYLLFVTVISFFITPILGILLLGRN